MRPIDRTPHTPGARLVAILLVWLVVLHPVASAATSCTARSLFAPGSCCCAPAAAQVQIVEETERSCCASATEPGPTDAAGSPTVERDAARVEPVATRQPSDDCRCQLDAPMPGPLHAVATASLRDLAPLEALATWLADGALRSSFVAGSANAHAPPGCADGPPAGCADGRLGRSITTVESPDATTLGCARGPLQHDGVRGFLAALSIALL